MTHPTTHASTHTALVCALLACAALSACNKPGPAEEAGRKMDESAERAAKAVHEKLEKAEDSAQDKGQRINSAVTDADITTKVKMALMMRDGLDSLTISVKTQAGVVTLSGSVANAAQSKLAQQLALAVNEVRSVNNQLSIVSPAR